MGAQTKQIQAAILISISMFATVTYLNFANFKPQHSTELKEVHGASDIENFGIPYPEEAKKLSSDKSPSGVQITLSSELSPQEVQEFYTNVFLSKGWEVETQGEAGVFFSTKFKQKNNPQKVTVTSSYQEIFGTTAIIIDIIEE